MSPLFLDIQLVCGINDMNIFDFIGTNAFS